MILGLGIDVIEVKRVEASLARFAARFEKRVFTTRERDYCRAKKSKAAESFALRWAAKEAVAKAMGTGIRGGVDFADIEVETDALGRPSIRLHGGAAAAAKKRGIAKFHLSLTHEGELAVAFAVAESVISASGGNRAKRACRRENDALIAAVAKPRATKPRVTKKPSRRKVR